MVMNVARSALVSNLENTATDGTTGPERLMEGCQMGL